jgi:3-deoxy-D-arabino-heptulosonate 7-phosphate (DAHP) synthase
MSRVSLKGICDMHVHTNPDLRTRAYNDLQLADAAVRVGARAIVIKSHLGFTVNRAAIANEYVKRVYGENTGFTMYGGVVMNKVIGGVNPEAVEKGLKLGAKEIWLTERGNMMGYNNLVVDFRNIPDMLDIVPTVIMDCTHSVQRPGGSDGKTGGDRRFVPQMALAAKAFGATGWFFEVHPDPDQGLSDAANMLELDKLDGLIKQLIG